MPIFADYRPLYKIAQLLLTLHLCSRGGKSSFIRLQLFNWILKDNERRTLLIDAVKNQTLDINVWGLDPSLNSAVQFSLAEGLIQRCNNGITLTENGKVYAEELVNKETMKDDIDFLKKIGKGITESMVSQVSDSWG